MNITIDLAIEYLFIRLTKKVSPEYFAAEVEALIWLMDAQGGADIYRVMREWLYSDEIEKVKAALAICQAALIDSDEACHAAVAQIVGRWPELKPNCIEFLQLRNLPNTPD
ncbi:MAG: hypothetical protein LCH85_20170 [Chloroflexi bacterium]|nr:hypothetical protein [Chloroflexota bacterium]